MPTREELLQRAKELQAPPGDPVSRARAILQQRRESGERYVPAPPFIQAITGARGDLPESPLKRADDLVRAAASGATFGFADEAAAAAGALTGPETYRERLTAERARDEAIDPKVRLAGEVGGALTTGLGLGRAGLSLLKNAPLRYSSLIGRGAGEGALYGGAHGFGHGEGVEGRLAETVRGGLTGAITGGGLGMITRGLLGGSTRPTSEAVRQQASELYDQASAAGVIVKGSRLARAVRDMWPGIRKLGFDEQLHPNAARVVRRLAEDAQQNHTLEGVEILRRVAMNAKGQATSDGERAIIREIVDNLDNVIENLKPQDIIGGRGIEAGPVLAQARKLWGVGRRAETVNDLVERAANQAGQFTGSGFENALRTQFRQLAQNPKRLRGFSQTEQQAIKMVARGDALGNVMRWLGKFAPRGVVSTALSGHTGHMIGGPAGTAGMLALGEGGRFGATALTTGKVQKVLDEIMNPLAKGPVSLNREQANLLRGLLLTVIEGEQTTGGAGLRKSVELLSTP